MVLMNMACVPLRWVRVDGVGGGENEREAVEHYGK